MNNSVANTGAAQREVIGIPKTRAGNGRAFAQLPINRLSSLTSQKRPVRFGWDATELLVDVARSRANTLDKKHLSE